MSSLRSQDNGASGPARHPIAIERETLDHLLTAVITAAGAMRDYLRKSVIEPWGSSGSPDRAEGVPETRVPTYLDAYGARCPVFW
jgi:hypothetical protein